MRILAIGAHPDDVELGCFGTLAKMQSEGHNITILVCTSGEVGGNPDPRKIEARKSADIIKADLIFGNLPDTRLSDGADTINLIETVIKKIKPDIIMVNHPNDTHQDHRNLARAAISSTRFGPDRVYFYESPSTSRSFMPTIFFDVTDHFNKKIKAVEIHESQGKKVYMANRAVKGLSEFRAFEIGLNNRLVEGFEPHRIVHR